MNMQEYSAAAMRTAKDMGSTGGNLTHAALGLTSDAGEFATVVKRFVCYGKMLDDKMRAQAIEELGDVLWFIVLAAETLNVTLENVAQTNIAKLMLRYPDKYSDEAAEARADKGGLPASQS